MALTPEQQAAIMARQGNAQQMHALAQQLGVEPRAMARMLEGYQQAQGAGNGGSFEDYYAAMQRNNALNGLPGLLGKSEASPEPFRPIGPTPPGGTNQPPSEPPPAPPYPNQGTQQPPGWQGPMPPPGLAPPPQQTPPGPYLTPIGPQPPQGPSEPPPGAGPSPGMPGEPAWPPGLLEPPPTPGPNPGAGPFDPSQPGLPPTQPPGGGPPPPQGLPPTRGPMNNPYSSWGYTQGPNGELLPIMLSQGGSPYQGGLLGP